MNIKVIEIPVRKQLTQKEKQEIEKIAEDLVNNNGYFSRALVMAWLRKRDYCITPRKEADERSARLYPEAFVKSFAKVNKTRTKQAARTS